jgi:hypothetical protein
LTLGVECLAVDVADGEFFAWGNVANGNGGVGQVGDAVVEAGFM